ncbi:sensor histidine kinase [Marivirga arenosa]|uniref:Sensor histidine kinase n=1 Tax=Marivirga arenosa TaxID=3059076 RepID=A0AA51ZY34_9BACT|nr:sensor histidine kinase [Marivirga sp. BKB1-2]WNB18868.1 sensor histidine kinase [Marivirga sp. BKB1-2]
MLKTKYLLNTVGSHAIFWSLIFSFFVVPTLGYQEQKLAYIGAYASKLLPQMILAYGMLFILVPYVLNRYGKVLFGISVGISLYLSFILYTFIRYYGFERIFPEYYRLPPEVDFWWRATDFHYFAQNAIWFLFPAVIFMSVRYYKHQREALELREQKKSAELNALKNQLNPHFLFNTLNNLYALTLKKSDQAPEVIAKLSEMLDYILYRCNEEYVPLKDELNLLNNYIALEKVRYGKRVSIQFESRVEQRVKIAPLLLITFFENAFKHGVSQEIKQAKIHAMLEADSELIKFSITNTVTSHKAESDERQAIGLTNVQKQLRLIYPEKHKLIVKEHGELFMVELKIELR